MDSASDYGSCVPLLVVGVTSYSKRGSAAAAASASVDALNAATWDENSHEPHHVCHFQNLGHDHRP